MVSGVDRAPGGSSQGNPQSSWRAAGPEFQKGGLAPRFGGEGSSPSRRQLWQAKLGLVQARSLALSFFIGGGEVQKRLGGSVSLHPSCILFVLWCGDWAHGWLGPNYSQTSPTGSICRSDGDQNCGEWEGGPRSTGRTPQAALALTRVSGICAVPAEHWTYSSLGSKATPHRVRLVLALLA